jgi:hypothetical protein
MDAKRISSFAAKNKNGVRNMRSTILGISPIGGVTDVARDEKIVQCNIFLSI